MKKTISDLAAQAFASLASYVEHEGIKYGTSATAGVSQVEINGKWYEIQLRLEGDEKSFIGENEVVQTQRLGAMKTMN